MSRVYSWIESFERLSVGTSPLIDSWPLFGSPIPVASILLFYITFVLFLGPKWMNNRDPYKLRIIIILYNACQVYYNWWIIKEMLTEKQFIPNFLNFGCTNVTETERIRFRNETYRAYWHGTMNKFLDLLDTVFFVLTKKQNHVTLLHVQHHTAAAAVLWIVAKYYSGLEIMVVGLCNMTVHMVMYFYYFVSSLGPSFKKYLWWKKHLTLLQIFQLIVIITYNTVALWFACNFNKNIIALLCIETGINLALFLNFYVKSYGHKNNFNMLAKKIAICGSLQIENEDKDKNNNNIENFQKTHKKKN
ncbi:very long chain fatty acid elongase 4-like [Culicoides brevitarsis]|uniref:very long chain fatty acid elongase 4-like n=1 Tax=Culicoides brevitarsis TaxID=469753 RepID=UPI00307CBB61